MIDLSVIECGRFIVEDAGRVCVVRRMMLGAGCNDVSVIDYDGTSC